MSANQKQSTQHRVGRFSNKNRYQSDLIPEQCNCALQALRNFKVSSMWAAIKEHRCRKHKNDILVVIEHVRQLREQMLLVPSYNHAEVQDALEAATPEGLQAFHSELLKDFHLEGLIEGNIPRSQAVETARCDLTHK
jgi:secreted Zn-dependent insulinase-like peptidase